MSALRQERYDMRMLIQVTLLMTVPFAVYGAAPTPLPEPGMIGLYAIGAVALVLALIKRK